MTMAKGDGGSTRSRRSSWSRTTFGAGHRFRPYLCDGECVTGRQCVESGNRKPFYLASSRRKWRGSKLGGTLSGSHLATAVPQPGFNTTWGIQSSARAMWLGFSGGRGNRERMPGLAYLTSRDADQRPTHVLCWFFFFHKDYLDPDVRAREGEMELKIDLSPKGRKRLAASRSPDRLALASSDPQKMNNQLDVFVPTRQAISPMN
ncbi:hypothetical protein EDB84DRAFT_1439824 [Lactarius hengduanensis]|nr:hypothetical protein EDB84DRAFT_1439824 [Lactarius hengduanensis]